MTVTLEKIHQAADAIAGQVVKTPCTRSRTLSDITGADVRLKFENHQFTASFKDRGALVKLLGLTSEQRKAPWSCLAIPQTSRWRIPDNSGPR